MKNGGIPQGNGIIGHIPVHKRAGCDNASITDTYPSDNHGICLHTHIITNYRRTARMVFSRRSIANHRPLCNIKIVTDARCRVHNNGSEMRYTKASPNRNRMRYLNTIQHLIAPQAQHPQEFAQPAGTLSPTQDTGIPKPRYKEKITEEEQPRPPSLIAEQILAN